MFLGLVLVASAANASLWSRAAGPKGMLMISSPLLQWQIWGDKGSVVAKFWCKVDGIEIPSRYVERFRRIEAQPLIQLKQGEHRIEMWATSSDEITVRKDWTVNVVADAHTTIPDVSLDQQLVLEKVNDFRATLGLQPVTPNRSMCAAARQHANYLAENRLTGHFQGEGSPNFVGVTPDDRLNAFGYVGGSMEVVQSGRADLDEALDMLIGAPYHRQAFLSGSAVEAGGSQFGERLVILFGDIQNSQTIVHPYDGQKGSPLAWHGRERPNPLRIHKGVTTPTGYPIVFSRASSDSEPIRFQEAALHEMPLGAPVDIVINSPENDTQLTDSVFLIPVQPLKPRTTYCAQVVARSPKGEDISRKWTFSTR